jgi:hypothetical protein
VAGKFWFGRPAFAAEAVASAEKKKYGVPRLVLKGNRGNPGEIDKVISRGKGRRELKM